MSVAPATEHGAKRRIGDILLDLGFVTEEQLAKAVEEHTDTKQPIGQILVEHGAITRLELASALAEQWSAHAPITPMPIQAVAARLAGAPAEPHDEDQYAARLQAAVADLAQRGDEHAVEESPDPRVTDLAQRLEATVARAQRLEATVATLAESLDGVTTGVEEAFSVLQSGMSGMALDLARIGETVVELAARPPTEDDPALTAARAAIETLEQRLTEVDTRSTVDAELTAQRETLGELRAAVEELAARPTGAPETDERLALVESRLDDALRTAADTARLDDLAARLDDGDRAQARLLDTVDALAHRVDELARPETGPGADAMRRVESVEARLAEIAPALEDVRRELADGTQANVPQRMEELGRTVAAVAAEVEALRRDDAGDAISETMLRLDGIESALGEQASLVERLDVLDRATADALTAEDLGRALDGLREELGAAADGPAARLGELTERLTAAEEALAGDTGRLRDDVETLRATVSDLRDAPATGADELVAFRHEVDGAIASLQARLDARPAPDPGQEHALAEASEQLGRRATALEENVAAVEARLDALAATAAPTGVASGDAAANGVESLRVELESALVALRHEIEALRAVPAGTDDDSAHSETSSEIARLQEVLEERLAAVETRLAEPLETLTPEDVDAAVSRSAAELAERADARLEGLASEIVTLRHEIEQALDRSGKDEAPGDERVDGLVAAVEALRAELTALHDERGPGAEVGPAGVGPDDLARAIEAVRSELVGNDSDLEPRIAQLASDMLALRAETARAAAVHADDAALTGTVSALEARLDDLERRASDEPTAAAPVPIDEIVEAVVARLPAETATAPADVSAARPTSAGVSGIPAPEGIEGDLERTRMAIERLGAHLGEHDRAIRELMKAQGGGRARGGDAATTVERGAADRAEAAADMRAVMRRIEGMEEDVREDREKLMKRLERLATSIDWRLQRLEAGD